jgi:hypothetical protein
MISEPTTTWESMKWDQKRQTRISDYLLSRREGKQDWIWFHEKPNEDLDAIGSELHIDFEKPSIGLLTSVMWDAQLHYKSKAFPNMVDWVRKTIDFFENKPDLQLVIRVHPAEIHGLVPSRQKMADIIKGYYDRLPANVFIVLPESRISTYALIERCNAALIYNTKAGIEVASMGIPVIVCGEAWIRNKGFSCDASSPEEYFRLLDQLPLSGGMDPDCIIRAQKYAFHFFFRRMIEIPFIVNRHKHKLELELNNLAELMPGRHKGFDVICEGILTGKPFVVEPEIEHR